MSDFDSLSILPYELLREIVGQFLPATISSETRREALYLYYLGLTCRDFRRAVRECLQYKWNEVYRDLKYNGIRKMDWYQGNRELAGRFERMQDVVLFCSDYEVSVWTQFSGRFSRCEFARMSAVDSLPIFHLLPENIYTVEKWTEFCECEPTVVQVLHELVPSLLQIGYGENILEYLVPCWCKIDVDECLCWIGFLRLKYGGCFILPNKHLPELSRDRERWFEMQYWFSSKIARCCSWIVLRCKWQLGEEYDVITTRTAWTNNCARYWSYWLYGNPLSKLSWFESADKWNALAKVIEKVFFADE